MVNVVRTERQRFAARVGPACSRRYRTQSTSFTMLDLDLLSEYLRRTSRGGGHQDLMGEHQGLRVEEEIPGPKGEDRPGGVGEYTQHLKNSNSSLHSILTDILSIWSSSTMTYVTI
jgi:hypothetical protein